MFEMHFIGIAINVSYDLSKWEKPNLKRKTRLNWYYVHERYYSYMKNKLFTQRNNYSDFIKKQ